MTTITDYVTASQTINGSQNRWIIDTTGMINVHQSSDTVVNALSEDGSDNTVVVKGVIAQFPDKFWNGAGISSTGDNFTLNVAKGGLVQGFFGVKLFGDNATMTNNGVIAGLGAGDGDGVQFVSANGTITNNGTIFARAIGIKIGDDGAITNNGTIVAGSIGVGYDNPSINNLDLVNHGTIHSNDAVSVGDGKDKIINDGRMIGNVDLQGGDDRIDTRGGTIKGSIFTGDGNDTLITDNAKIRLTEVDTGGLDIVRSTVSYTLNAWVEILRLIGKANINGTATDTTQEREYLFGNIGKNTLSGLGGNDVLDGGAGNDILIGGSGLDLFVFKKGYGVDTINDFHHSESDHIIIDGVNDYSQIESKLEKHGKDTWVNFGHGDVIVVKHVTPNHLHHDDFAL